MSHNDNKIQQQQIHEHHELDEDMEQFIIYNNYINNNNNKNNLFYSNNKKRKKFEPHNNGHSQPQSSYHSTKKYEFDTKNIELMKRTTIKNPINKNTKSCGHTPQTSNTNIKQWYPIKNKKKK